MNIVKELNLVLKAIQNKSYFIFSLILIFFSPVIIAIVIALFIVTTNADIDLITTLINFISNVFTPHFTQLINSPVNNAGMLNVINLYNNLLIILEDSSKLAIILVIVVSLLLDLKRYINKLNPNQRIN
ncbi:hypothetical protein [Clostridium estertheticum]|uniref:hypothetical protein n=1 Tax=Clostridium estertheticum TaxID=238834 RepID=UPI001C0C81A2|nr:hypothetical protein [Clostridium estertheticum]MBU3173378.1 hypothetical protein [Clostridium estertheticum]